MLLVFKKKKNSHLGSKHFLKHISVYFFKPLKVFPNAPPLNDATSSAG